MSQSKNPRRRNLLKGAAVAAGAMTAPMLAKAQAGPISMRWQSTWQEAPRDPLAWYQKAVAEGVTGTQKAFQYVEEHTQAVTRAAERLQATAEQAGRQIQETLTGTVTKVKEIFGQS